MTYNYDLAGDITSWTHPAGFTITNTVNNAQEITQIQSSLVDSTHPQYLAQNITYTSWGAESTLENGCAGSGCTDTVETYTYNQRLQPLTIGLGTSSNPFADYCLVYNWYANSYSPNSCTPTPQGFGGDNDMLYNSYYGDNVNPSLSHTELFSYDGDLRLITAQATGNSTYNLTFSYDRYGNMTCTINGNTNGPCPLYSFNQSTNRINTSGFTYDAAGNLTADGTYGYQYDAEERLSSVSQGNVYTYNALGLRAVWGVVQYLYDPQGALAGTYISATNGWQQTFPVAGRRVAWYYQGSTYFYHLDHLGSVNGITASDGSLAGDALYYPWGQSWSLVGAGMTSSGPMFGSFTAWDGNVGSGIYPGQFRVYPVNLGRWFTPDPLGGDIMNPQSFNRYAYALNNPTTNVDPLGLDSCSPGATCVTVTAPPPPGIGLIQGMFTNVLSNQGLIDQFICRNDFGMCGAGRNFDSFGAWNGFSLPAHPAGITVPLWPIVKQFNKCAANVADKYSAASLLHVNNVPGLGAVLGSSTAAASNLLFGTHPSEYVPAGANLAAAVKAGTILVKGAGELGNIPINQGFQSIFTTIAPTNFGQTAVGQFLIDAAGRAATLLDKALPLQIGYDEALYGAGEAACTAQALGW